MTEIIIPGVYIEELSASHTLASFKDVPLPASEIKKLEEFYNALRVHKGLLALFTGEAGTGQTLTAEVLAKKTGKPGFRIDLSQVMNKYIGETEKNLDKIFAYAESAEAILFFDEADALFGKRSAQKDAHERFTNIEVSYLLQKLENCKGAVILSSNDKENIDEVFFRRIHTIIEFPPSSPLRKPRFFARIWQWIKYRVLNIKNN